MKERDHPRLLVYGTRINEAGQVIADPDTILGFPNGYTNATIDRWAHWQEDYEYDDFLALNPVFTNVDDPIFFQTYAEVEFMLAEAAVRGWNVPGAAASRYEAGVRAAMDYLSLYDAGASIPATEIDTYLDANPLTGAPAEQLDQINTQYWAASCCMATRHGPTGVAPGTRNSTRLLWSWLRSLRSRSPTHSA